MAENVKEQKQIIYYDLDTEGNVEEKAEDVYEKYVFDQTPPEVPASSDEGEMTDGPEFDESMDDSISGKEDDLSEDFGGLSEEDMKRLDGLDDEEEELKEDLLLADLPEDDRIRFEERIRAMEEDIATIKQGVSNLLDIKFDMMYQSLRTEIHEDAIKTYRNIQAVIVEEDAKQNHVLFGMDGNTNKLKNRMNHLLIFSIVSFVTSILVMLMQILPALGFNLF